MKKEYLATATVILVCAVSLCISISYAQKSLASGYQITTDHHGIDVIVGETVTAWADTTNLTTTKVNFTWIFDDSETKRTVNSTSYDIWFTGEDGWPEQPGVPNGTEVRRFTDSYGPFEPDEIGEWAVKAKFINSYGQTWASDNDSFPVRATSFEVIPEVPLGTIAIILTMFGAIGFFAIRKRKIPLPI